MWLAMKATVTTISSKPWVRNRPTMCSIIGTLAMGIIGLGALDVRGRSRVPSPPAMMTAFIPRPYPGLPRIPQAARAKFSRCSRWSRRRAGWATGGPALRQRGAGERDVAGRGVEAEHQPGDAGEPGEDAGEVGPAGVGVAH